ncbi:hypothetical protein EVAR_98081_1 [Eumeta japonica]|uniref:Secreted protein n=1 Tax=Eumeta variegata TaxID=151549 RepID=A0A4C1WFI6_EUMVA|nr:hypothetical protein EVAR_98081_1 [Eumeta japonica]
MCFRACVRLCVTLSLSVCVCVCVCVRAWCVRVCVRACVRACLAGELERAGGRSNSNFVRVCVCVWIARLWNAVDADASRAGGCLAAIGTRLLATRRGKNSERRCYATDFGMVRQVKGLQLDRRFAGRNVLNICVPQGHSTTL